METAVIRQFLDFFQDFLKMCQSETWLNNETSMEEIRNALIISQHIEKCLYKLQRKALLDDFLSSLNKNNNLSSTFFKNCFIDPPKCILKKILQSNIDTKLIDISFTIFLELFSESKLEECLSGIMLEIASQDTLLKNLPVLFPFDKVMTLKSLVLLSELNSCVKISEVVIDMLVNYDKDLMEILVMCLLNNDSKFEHTRNEIVSGFLRVMLCKDMSNQKFWKLLFDITEEKLVQLCLSYRVLSNAISKAIIDCGKLIKENMSSEYFYVSLTYSELKVVLHKIYKNNSLKLQFLNYLHESNSDLDFWNNALQS